MFKMESVSTTFPYMLYIDRGKLTVSWLLEVHIGIA